MKSKNAVFLLMVLILSFPWACGAQAQQLDDPLADLFSDEPEFLKEEHAFQFDFAQNDNELVDTFDIAEGYN